MINVQNLTVIRHQRSVLDRFNLQLNPQQRLVLHGSVGCGKTTLLHTLLGFLPFSGEIKLFGQTCRHEKDFVPFRGKIGLLFQHPDDQLFGPKVIDDVAFGPLNQGYSKEQAYELAHRQLEKLEISHLAERAVNHLSGGEKNFTALAGVLAMQPQVLLLDEPTNGLDPKTVKKLTALLAELPLTMIIASHHLEFSARIATDILDFDAISPPSL
ncbi:energy-coupling factor ABC transporter ATP-binding protein [Actinobacillus porcinus]|uniref:Cobalt ABC transporter ATPase n=1 Tax=Actinobacillus porcinus TaxID=51048 RepID=A0ABY6TKW5_9PAST|nr:energy-coupling factor ABC transporter ATP-binding protein [Actinobacillus porcinus]VFY92750.1 cobalt ABC transporter ATPase [Actinobacillus porcinus]VTU07218.1 cobalt ABC transporter ATPase [Actinobacillus porcinus]